MKKEHYYEMLEDFRQLQEENKKYKQALEFYANEEKYEEILIPSTKPITQVSEDRGEIARRALGEKKIKGC